MPTEIPSNSGPLTKRETEILEMIVLGLSNKAIAAQLKLELREVEVLRVQLMNKLGVTTVRELIQLALASGTKPGTFPTNS